MADGLNPYEPPPVSEKEMGLYIQAWESFSASGGTTELEALCDLSPLRFTRPYLNQYVLRPPSWLKQDEWDGALREYEPFGINTTWLRRSGEFLVPIDIGCLREEDRRLVKSHGYTSQFALLDCSCGVVLFPSSDGRSLCNWGIDRSLVDRYAKSDSRFSETPVAILSVGAMRGYHALTGRTDIPPHPVEMTMKTRHELDELLATIRDKAQRSQGRLQLWFRGQPHDYQTKSIDSPHFPWRSVSDSSLVPSLYRNFKNRLTALQDYGRLIHELNLYALMIRNRLDLRPFTRRAQMDEPVDEPLPETWDDWHQGDLSVKLDDLSGNTIAVRDYHFAFHALQQSFFFQHYGLPSCILDITCDLDVAIFFAMNGIGESGTYERVDMRDACPTLYVFILDQSVDTFLSSDSLLGDRTPLRPRRQKCGILCGSSSVNRNYYSSLIAIKIRLAEALDSIYDVRYLFPGAQEDDFLQLLQEFHSDLQLEATKPFALWEN